KRRSPPRPMDGTLSLRLSRAKKKLAAIKEIDFFDAPARAQAVASVAALEDLVRTPPIHKPMAASLEGLVGRTWITRRGIQVDRIASAWFIRRFIDPRAHLRFVDPASPDKRPGEISYDMVGGDFSHEGDRCSFETLILRTGIRD